MAKKVYEERLVPESDLKGFSKQFNTDIDVATYRRIREIAATTGLNQRQILDQAIAAFHKSKVH